MNKSLATNLVALLVLIISYFSPEYPWRVHLVQSSLFALSGAFTNWIAIYMLFEKIPGLYGSGVIPDRFEEFKGGIRSLVMSNFFTRENFEKYVTDSVNNKVDIDEIIDQLFNELVLIVKRSSIGAMLGVFGNNALEPLRRPFKEKIKNLFYDSGVVQKLTANTYDVLKPQVDAIVNQKLDELTPQKVKEIIQDMIHEHLGWLVVWGGVFGALIGLICSFVI